MDEARFALGLSLISLCVAVGGLGLQWANHRRRSPRLTLEFDVGPDFSVPEHPWVLTVRATNNREAPLTLISLGILVRGVRFDLLAPPHNIKLDPGTTATVSTALAILKGFKTTNLYGFAKCAGISEEFVDSVPKRLKPTIEARWRA